MRKIACVPIVLLLLNVSLLFAQESDQGTYDDVARRVEKKIQDKKKVNIQDLKVLHRNGTIYLEGTTDLYGSRYEAEQEALEVEGVQKVINEIAVTTAKASDLEIEAEAIRKIRTHMRGTPFDLVSVKVSNGFVTLTGNVRDQTLVDEALDSVIWIRGVRGVQNRIERSSIAAGDERLRQGIYRRLYREFPQYFVGSQPSILILVNSGRVQLVGYVDSKPTREKIGSIVRSFVGVLSVENQLQTN